jgi:broad specificity phosphatase PhoE
MVPSYPPIYVLRHGETTWNREGRLQGHLDAPLTKLGRTQAAAQNAILRSHLPEGAVALSSDSGRSVETARIALRGLDVPCAEDPRLREVALGDWQGRTVAEIEAGWGFLTEGRDPFDWKFDAPGGESLADFTARARAVLDELTGPTVLITHGLTSRVLRCLALGRPPEDIGALPGGQGVVHLVDRGKAEVLTP